MLWKAIVSAEFQNYAETVAFYKISTPETYMKLRYFTQRKGEQLITLLTLEIS